MGSACRACLLPLEPGRTYHPSCSRALFGTEEPPELGLSREEVERLAVESVNLRLSIAGVQRKLSVGSVREGGHLRLTVVGALGGTHILKPPHPDYPGMVELEHWSMRRAARLGIHTAPCGLLPMESGEFAYVVRRFDRARGDRIPVEDLCQVAGQAVSDKYRSSMERVGALVRRFARVPGEDALRVFEIAVFCLMDANADMHLKNWSLMGAPGAQTLSPAYDLLPTRLLTDDPEESALPIHGKKSRIRRADLLAFADHLRIPSNVAIRALDRIRTDHVHGLDELASPWVPQGLADRLRVHARETAARLGE
jgi:serine/threonine-protein kinase HipA